MAKSRKVEASMAIKARAWRSDFRQFLYVVLVNQGVGSMPGGTIKANDLEPWELFTGRLDETGTELYAGDIMLRPRVTNEPNYPSRGFGVIIWNDSQLAWGLRWWDREGKAYNPNFADVAHNYRLKVGNIHENPELLKGKG